ncbi:MULTISPECIES: ABC transporter ATP-binding protein [Burkholderia]|uniref:ABC transporter ATP-binding protein n=1 Tax=Burkholderia TaxID=32008 RepID=UPI000327F46B|nr:MULTISPECIES: ABC transporter ATP-binding protein [Burkholderia]AGK50038.1 fe(3+) ions import ATP-binding FbpC domain protein [Burkholderia thailandensis MSMB121]ATF32837.1 ABC transporter ATP-binding protein [Burkholderia thailandensis]KST70986.1 sugar ABC transporter [Burkholderia humptydooensis]KVN16663.1 sugar ABC transporter [Burkholderia sp. MSMB1552]KWZ51065.1 sugar ABC transporter [Burkholderia sp. MSMB1588]
MSELRIDRVCKSFDGHAVLHDVSLAVGRGALLALLGPSGSGKTTLLRILCGFERAERGTVDIDGQRVAGPGVHVPPEARRIGYVPQEGALFPHLSVADNIAFGLPRAQRRAHHRVAELLDMVGLPAAFAQRAPQQLSGGQQQRVALARALAPKPSLVILDEPFSSLDASLRLETRAAVVDALAAARATAVLVTHDQPEALSLGDEVAVLWHGRLVQTARPETLYRQPATRELAMFIGDAVLIEGVVERGFVVCALGYLPLRAPLPDGPVDALLRPEQIRVRRMHEPRDDCTHWRDAIVLDATFGGQDAYLDAQLVDFPGACVRARVPGYRCPSAGERIALAVDDDVIAYPRCRSTNDL